MFPITSDDEFSDSLNADGSSDEEELSNISLVDSHPKDQQQLSRLQLPLTPVEVIAVKVKVEIFITE